MDSTFLQLHQGNHSHHYPPITTGQPGDKTDSDPIIGNDERRKLGDSPVCSCGTDRSTVQSPFNWQELSESISSEDISEHDDETDSDGVRDMHLAYQPSHCCSMGAAIPTEMPESTKYIKSPHKDLNLCQAESEVSVELLRRGVNTKEHKALGLKIHPALCR